MKKAKELIEAIRDVPEDIFNQDSYLDRDEITGKKCGCVMHHYEINALGGLCSLDYWDEFGLGSRNEYHYLFGSRTTINFVASENGWPPDFECTVQSAIKRIEFIDNLTKEK